MNFAQVVGFLGVFLNLMIYQHKTRTRVLVNKIVANGVWAIHYFLLDAYTATCIAIVGAISTFVFMKVDSKSLKGRLWLGFFVLVNIISGILTWNTAVSLLAVTASVISNISFFVGVPKYTRRFALVISLCMGTYGFLNGSVAVVVNEVLTVISTVSGIIRLDIGKGKGYEG